MIRLFREIDLDPETASDLETAHALGLQRGIWLGVGAAIAGLALLAILTGGH